MTYKTFDWPLEAPLGSIRKAGLSVTYVGWLHEK